MSFSATRFLDHITDTVALLAPFVGPQSRRSMDAVLDLTGFWDRLFAFTAVPTFSQSSHVIPDEGHVCMMTGGAGTY